MHTIRFWQPIIGRHFPNFFLNWYCSATVSDTFRKLPHSCHSLEALMTCFKTHWPKISRATEHCCQPWVENNEVHFRSETLWSQREEQGEIFANIVLQKNTPNFSGIMDKNERHKPFCTTVAIAKNSCQVCSLASQIQSSITTLINGKYLKRHTFLLAEPISFRWHTKSSSKSRTSIMNVELERFKSETEIFHSHHFSVWTSLQEQISDGLELGPTHCKTLSNTSGGKQQINQNKEHRLSHKINFSIQCLTASYIEIKNIMII